MNDRWIEENLVLMLNGEPVEQELINRCHQVRSYYTNAKPNANRMSLQILAVIVEQWQREKRPVAVSEPYNLG